VPALAGVLAAEHEVTLVTDAGHGDGLPDPSPGVRRVRAERPASHAIAGFACAQHAYSAAVLSAIESAYGEGPGPDLLEAPDYTAESFVALQAARAGHELLAGTRFAVRLRGTLELALLHDDVWPDDEEVLAVYAMEREVLARADRLLHAGGGTHAACARYYGEHALAPATRIRLPLPPLPAPLPHVPGEPGGPLRLLYVGRLERRKGVLELVEALTRLPTADVRLTLAGGDTAGGPLGRSMRETLEVMAGGDERIEFLDARPRAELQALMAASDVVVLPSRFEWWANVAAEAMHAGVPILATPVGGFAEQVAHGETGWLTDGTDVREITAAIAHLAEDLEAVEAIRASGAPRRRLATLTDPRDVMSGYAELLTVPLRRPLPARAPATMPRITAVIPARDAGELVRDAVQSFLTQAGGAGDVVVVDDGSGASSLEVLAGLAEDPRVRVVHQRHRGPGAARNTGIDHAEGEYVLFLDADDMLEPGALRQMLAALAADPRLGYAVPWMRMEYPGGAVDHAAATGWCPLGAGLELIDEANVVGGSCVLVPRRVFSELGHRFNETSPLKLDREFLEQLWRAGLPGAVVPAPLLRYRISAGGLTVTDAGRHRRVAQIEMRARLRARETTWTATTG
jgi:glycosyltransferase involved in cell wall biosynthesis/GT2 family glycosyltransferase